MEFQAFPKLQRLTGPVIVTEKIDGTNAAIIIENGEIAAQSRTRIITPEKDNFGFALWVHDNKDTLIELLGEGRHFGEWWGKGIQRGYGVDRKYFSLFNTSRWLVDPEESKWGNYTLLGNTIGVCVVPTIFIGTFVEVIEQLPVLMDYLKYNGSEASIGYNNPEGVVIYDTRSGQGYKKTFDYDDTGKGGQKDENGNVI